MKILIPKRLTLGELLQGVDALLSRIRAHDRAQKVQIARLKSALNRRIRKQPMNEASDSTFVIKGIVAEVCKVPIEIFMVRGTRERWQTWPRHLAMYFCDAYRLGVLRDIGIQFGGYDHSTVLTAKRVVKDELALKHMTEWKRQYNECFRRVQVALGPAENLRQAA